MQVKIFLTKGELTKIAQQATLIQDIEDSTLIVVTIDNNDIAIDVPNMTRSYQKDFDKMMFNGIEKNVLETIII